MAAPSYAMVMRFNRTTKQLQAAASQEFMTLFNPGMSLEEVTELAAIIGEKYGLLGSELGAQWYELCSRLAGVEYEAAQLVVPQHKAVFDRAREWAMRSTVNRSVVDAVTDFLSNEVQNSIRTTGSANLWRDYERGAAPGRWARVPVGDTCAWCLMLASQGAWYVSEETAIGANPGHYHSNCNCVAVYHANPSAITGYGEKLSDYKRQYYQADDIRRSGDMDEELQQRIAKARDEHTRNYEEGKSDIPWSEYNETLIVMREKFGLS